MRILHRWKSAPPADSDLFQIRLQIFLERFRQARRQKTLLDFRVVIAVQGETSQIVFRKKSSNTSVASTTAVERQCGLR